MGRHLAQCLLHFSPTSNFMAWALAIAFPYVGIQEHLMAAVCEIKSGLWL